MTSYASRTGTFDPIAPATRHTGLANHQQCDRLTAVRRRFVKRLSGPEPGNHAARFGPFYRLGRLPEVHVSFVCSGNICRSPTAALVFAEHLRHAGLADSVRVSSAGVGPWHVGEPIDPRAGALLARHGYPVEHVAAQIGAQHLDADLFLAMDAGHEQALRTLVGDPDRVRLLRSFDPTAGPDLDVPDPYYGGADGFGEVLGMIEAAMPGLLGWVRKKT
jgi:low molecular weight protein-tyrosine phosphatase